jgi:predicted  nucleic acid-binding Zn-ribbon protein
MDSIANTDLLESVKRLVAENKSYESRLEDYARIIYSRDSEIEMLQSMLAEANEYRSSLDEQVKELKELKRSMIDIQRQAASSTYMVNGKQQRAGESVSLEAQFEHLKQDYAFLQSQLTDLQSQLLEVNNRNMLLMLQTSRVAELESLLAIFEQSNDTSGLDDNRI